MDELNEMHMPIWAYRAKGKTTAGGGGTLIYTITFNERGKILFGAFGPNDYAANRTITGVLRDKDGNNIAKTLVTTTIDNNTIPMMASGGAPSVDEGIDFQQQLVVGSGDKLYYVTDTLAQNEELTIAMRVLTLGISPPTVALTGSGTETNTVDYDELI